MNLDDEHQPIVCPACQNENGILINGVCGQCRKTFEYAHKNGNLETVWKPQDFIYHEVKSTIPFVIMDDEDAAKLELKAANIEAKDFFKRLARILIQYKGNKTLALYAFCFACEWYDVIECETAVEIAVKLFKNPRKKAAVTKAILMFQSAGNIEPGRGQRSEIGKKNMATAREKQLK